MRPGRVLLALALVGLALLVLTHPGRVAVKGLLVLPHLFPNPPALPLTWVTGEPRLEELRYAYAAGPVAADVYHPAEAGRHGAVVVVLGAGSRPKDDPALVRFAQGLARAGAVVLVPESESLRAGHVQPADADMLALAVERLRAMPDVDPARVGLIGFSVGGGLAVLAAEQPRVRDQIAFVNTVGAYFDAPALLEQIATRSQVLDGTRRPWQPSEHTLRMFKLALMEALPDSRDRMLLERWEPGAARDFDPYLTSQGRAVLRMLDGVDAADFAATREQLPPGAVEHLAAISPLAGLDRMRARLYVMHDLNDTYIPVAQARELAARQPPGLALYAEFDIFQHVTPDRSSDALTFGWNVAKLYRQLTQVGLEFL